VYEYRYRKGRKFVNTYGEKWTYQPSSDIQQEINKHLPKHFAKWKFDKTDKDHPLFMVFSGPGVGKSRLLDQFPKLAKKVMNYCQRITIQEGVSIEESNLWEVQQSLDNPFIFKISFENGMSYRKESEGHNPSIILGNRMMWQMSGAKTFHHYHESVQPQFTVTHVFEKLPDGPVLLLIDGLQRVHKVDTVVYQGMYRLVCDLINDYPRFVVAVLAATLRTPIDTYLISSKQTTSLLIPQPLNGHEILRS